MSSFDIDSELLNIMVLAEWRAPLSRPWHSNAQLPRVLQALSSHWLVKTFFTQLTTKAINVWPLMLALPYPSLVILLWVITWWNMIWLTTWLGGNNKFVNFELFGSYMLGTLSLGWCWMQACMQSHFTGCWISTHLFIRQAFDWGLIPASMMSYLSDDIQEA